MQHKYIHNYAYTCTMQKNIYSNLHYCNEMLVAVRDSRALGDSVLHYILRGEAQKIIHISESSAMVDGIGEPISFATWLC